MNAATTSRNERASRTRYAVVALAAGLAAVTYLDRACIGTLAPDIMRDLHLSKKQMTVVYSAFSLSYALLEIPTARWADRMGTRRVLSRIVLWWSFFVMATAAAFNQASLVAVRFLFGAGEAGAWPCVARTFARWMPDRERGLAQGIFFAGAHLSGGLTPLLVVALSGFIGWRTIFALFGALGLVWVALWHWWFRDDPAQHHGVNAVELELISAGRRASRPSESRGYWRNMICDKNVLSLCLMYCPSSFAFYFCITWLPTYLSEGKHLDAARFGFFAGLPLILSVVSDLSGGFATDWLCRHFGPRIGRCGLGIVSNLLASAAMMLATVCDSASASAWLISIAVAAGMLTLPASWATCVDVGGDDAGVVSGMMNTAGQLASFLSPLVVTALLGMFGSWNVPLRVMSSLFLLGVLGWQLIDPKKPIMTRAAE